MDQKKTGYFLKQLRNEKKLTQEQIRQEVTALQDMGHKRLAIEAGEDPKNNPHGVTLGDGKQYARYQHAVGTCRFL